VLRSGAGRPVVAINEGRMNGLTAPARPGFADGMRRLLALVAVVVGACRSASPPLAPAIRFVETPAPVPGPLEWGAYVTIGSESRLALTATSAAPVVRQWSETVPPGGARSYPLALPEALRAASWVFLEPYVEVCGRWERQPTRVIRPAGGEESKAVEVRFPGLRPGEGTRVTVNARAAPELEERDVVTAPVDVPPGAVLSFALGVEEAAWDVGAAPLEFTVTALDGGREEIVLRRRLDPARAPADRGWVEVRVPLGGLVRRRVRFRLAARAVGGAGSSLPVWSDPVMLAPRPRPAVAGVVLVSLDTLRAVSVGAYGAARPTTPSLDARMAARGTLFEHAIAPFPHTLPSHLSMFTGLYERRHGVRGLFQALDAGRRTLPEALRAAGYETAAFTEDGFLVAEAGIRRGFAVYGENRSADIHRPVGQIEDTFRRGLAWLARHADEPFFLFLHTYQVHQPYTPPPRYATFFGDPTTIAEASERDRLLYEQEVRYTDDQVAALLDGLDALGLGERALVIVTADHGEEFLEHGQRYHGYQLYDEVLRVPLLVRWPGRVPAGLRVGTPVSLVDLVPTLLELLGIPPLPDVDGVSLVPLLRDPPAPFARTTVFAEAPSSYTSGTVDLVAARTGTLKCIGRDGAAAQCFDLAADPAERKQLDGSAAARTADLMAAIDAFRTQVVKRPTEREPAATEAEREQKLRALGYVNDGR